MSLVLVYDIEVFEDKERVFCARSVRGAGQAHELVAEFYRRKRAPGATPSSESILTCHRVEGESLHKSHDREAGE